MTYHEPARIINLAMAPETIGQSLIVSPAPLKGGFPFMEEMLLQISNFGFPIVVSAYLLIRIEKKLCDLSNNITDLTRAIDFLSLKKDSQL